MRFEVVEGKRNKQYMIWDNTAECYYEEKGMIKSFGDSETAELFCNGLNDDRYEDENAIEDEDNIKIITMNLEAIREFGKTVDKPIHFMPVPTAYGLALFLDLSKYQCSMDTICEYIPDGYMFLPAKIKTATLSDGMITECLSIETGNCEYGIVVKQQPVNMKYGYCLIPIGIYTGMSCIASDLKDMKNALKSWMAMYENTEGESLLKLPCKGCIISNKEEQVNAVTDSIRTYETLPERAMSWYINTQQIYGGTPYVYVIQEGYETQPQTKEEGKIISSATKGMIILQEIQEEDLEELCQ